MSDNNYFRKALANFTHNAASGGAIAHLADLGYTPQEIRDMLDFPTSYARVQESFWDHLVERGIIAEAESNLARCKETVRFVTDHGHYGRTSIRRVVETAEDGKTAADPADFRKVSYDERLHGAFADFLLAHCGAQTYVSCDFGLSEKPYAQVLSQKERLYIEGVPWRRTRVWHQLDLRMAGIIAALQSQAAYHGELLLLEEEIRFIF